MAIYIKHNGKPERLGVIGVKHNGKLERIASVWIKTASGLVKIYEAIRSCYGSGRWRYGKMYRYGDKWRYNKK